MVVRRMAMAVALVLLAIVAARPVGAQPAPLPPQLRSQDGPPGEIRGSIAVTGNDLFAWIDDDLCVITFPDYDPTPELIISDADGRRVAVVPLADLSGKTGFASGEGQRRAVSCTADYAVAISDVETYRLVIDPYYSVSVARDELSAAGWVFGIAFSRDDNDPAPDFHRRPAGPIPGTDAFLLAGTFELVYEERSNGNPNFFSMPILGCSGLGGYDDIQARMRVTITDEAGTIIAASELEPLFTEIDECQFIFSAELPPARFYTFELGRRGSLTYSMAEMESSDWRVDFVLGS